MDDVEKLKSIHGITGIWVEETTEITLSDFLQINLRLRGKTENYKQVILTFNPIDANHWLNKTELENCFSLKSTYLDNAFCDDEYKEVIRALAGQDENFYNIYATAYRDWETDRKSTRLNSSHRSLSRMPSSA